MQLRHSYWWFKEALSPEICDRIIGLGLQEKARLESCGRDTTAWTYGNEEKQSKPNAAPQGDRTRNEILESGENPENTYVRDSNVVWLNEQWIYDLVKPKIAEANRNAGWNWEIDGGTEALQFTIYKPGGFYSWHRDGMSDHPGRYKRYIHGITPQPLKDGHTFPAGFTNEKHMIGKIRKISMTINLCSEGDYDGGNLKFDFGAHNEDGRRYHECEEIRPRGSMIVFPSWMPHCVTPVTRGVRYSLVLWSLGEPFK